MLDKIKQDINKLQPYKNGFTMSDIYSIKLVFNDLATKRESYFLVYKVKQFYSKKRYNLTIKERGCGYIITI